MSFVTDVVGVKVRTSTLVAASKAALCAVSAVDKLRDGKLYALDLCVDHDVSVEINLRR